MVIVWPEPKRLPLDAVRNEAGPIVQRPSRRLVRYHRKLNDLHARDTRGMADRVAQQFSADATATGVRAHIHAPKCCLVPLLQTRHATKSDDTEQTAGVGAAERAEQRVRRLFRDSLGEFGRGPFPFRLERCTECGRAEPQGFQPDVAKRRGIGPGKLANQVSARISANTSRAVISASRTSGRPT